MTTNGDDLELELDARCRVARFDACQSLYVTVECPRRDFGATVQDGIDQGVVDEDVLVLSLHHVVALRPQDGHVTVHVDGPFVTDSFEHRVDDDDGTGSTDAGAAESSEESNIDDRREIQRETSLCHNR
jgi:hypothetical protein